MNSELQASAPNNSAELLAADRHRVPLRRQPTDRVLSFAPVARGDWWVVLYERDPEDRAHEHPELRVAPVLGWACVRMTRGGEASTEIEPAWWWAGATVHASEYRRLRDDVVVDIYLTDDPARAGQRLGVVA